MKTATTKFTLTPNHHKLLFLIEAHTQGTGKTPFPTELRLKMRGMFQVQGVQTDSMLKTLINAGLVRKGAGSTPRYSITREGREHIRQSQTPQAGHQ